MSKPDCNIDTDTAAIDGYLEGMIIGNDFADSLDKLVELSQKLKRDITCLITVKYADLNAPAEEDDA